MRHNACDLSPELLLQSRSPGYQLEAEAIVNHGEPTRRECDALTVNPGHILALGRRRRTAMQRKSYKPEEIASIKSYPGERPGC
jgi:hypothetical protein